jgi:hypothetical protein
VASVVFSKQGGGDLLAAGTVLCPDGQNMICTLQDGSEELVFEIIVEKTQGSAIPGQLSFNLTSATTAQFIFKGASSPFGSLYNVPIGTINGRKLSTELKLTRFRASYELSYAFWAEPL